MSTRRLLSFVSLFVLASCSTTGPAPSGSAATPSAGDSPELRSAYFERNWGPAERQIKDDGAYRLTYRQDGSLNFLFLESRPKPVPAPATPPPWKDYSSVEIGPGIKPELHAQTWRQTTILGSPVLWYQVDGGSGADFPLWRTVDFPLTAPDGRTAYYRVSVSAVSEQDAVNWINRVDW